MKSEALKKTVHIFWLCYRQLSDESDRQYFVFFVPTPLLQQTALNDMKVLNFFLKTHCQEDQTAFYMNHRKNRFLLFDYLHVFSLCVLSAFVPFLYSQE